MDLFLAKVNESGTALLYLSYIGGGSYLSTDLTWTRPGRLMIYGSTNTRSLPLSDRAYSRVSKGERDGFISIFNSESMAPEYSTLFGGSHFDFVRSAFFLDEDRVVLSGETNSPDFPLTGNALYAGTRSPTSRSTTRSSARGGSSSLLSTSRRAESPTRRFSVRA